MSGNFFLNWSMLTVSLFNTILLLWLALTVLLNAERRVWGIWLAAGGLMLGAIFFVSHSAIVGQGISPVTPGLNLWLKIGWIPIIALPLAWYIVMLWYSGFWGSKVGNRLAQSNLYQRHKIWFILALVTGLILVSALLVSDPLSSLSQLTEYQLSVGPSIGGIPLLILAYPFYTLLCTGLSLEVLLRPEPSGRFMGDLARPRSRRWLISASVILLVVGLLAGWVMAWIVLRAQQGLLSLETVETAGWFDLGVEALIATAVLSLGQAIVSYEIFTGKTLPRRGLSQYWKRAIILAAGYSPILAWSLTNQFHPIYSLLLSLLLMVIFYALLGWRAYAERERFIQNLRPFMAQKRFYEDILAGEGNQTNAGTEDIYEPFQALCTGVLEARQACLLPLGALAPLSGPALIYPRGSRFLPPDLDLLTSSLDSPGELGIPLDPESSGGMIFAVSLWSERGLIGILLIGEKESGGLYTQEEIEIARAAGEHMVDTKASMEMARRLVSLQRQRLVQSQILDQQSRRVLHDEVLPQVHTALLNLTSAEVKQDGEIRDTLSLLEEIHHQLSDLLRSTQGTTAVELSRLGFIGALKRSIEVDADGSFDKVTWDVQPGVERKLAGVPELIAEVLFFATREAIRNAARHGRQKEDGTPFCLSIRLEDRNGLAITVEDNGAGFSLGEEVTIERSEQSRLLGEDVAASSFSNESSRERSKDGRGGQGLTLHSTMMAVIGGFLSVESAPGQYTRVLLELPEQAWERWE